MTSARLASLEPRIAETAGPAPPPPRTVTESVRQARTALRLYREAASQGTTHSRAASSSSSSSSNGDRAGAARSEAEARSGSHASASSSSTPASSTSSGPRKLIVELPLPVNRTGFLGRGEPAAERDLVRLTDEADWPGGEVQRFRTIKVLVEGLLEGYESEFLGFLEDGADGVGLWTLADGSLTVIANVTNATVPSLVKLLDGGYGARVTLPGHTLVAVNPQWTDAQSVGQPWQWGLRSRAAEVLEPSSWDTLYTCRMLRGSRGANGLLHRAWPHRWAVYPAATPDTRVLGEVLLATPERPPRQLILEKLNEAKPDMQRRAKELGLDDPSGRLW